MRRPHHTAYLLTSICGLLLTPSKVLAQPGTNSTQPKQPTRTTQPKPAGKPTPKQPTNILANQRKANDIARQAEVAFAAADFAKGEALLRQQCDLEPESWIPRHNLAIALAMQDKQVEAAAMLKEAIEMGFFDLRGLQRTRPLEKAAAMAPIDEWIKDWPAVLERQAQRTLANLQEALGPGAEITRDDDHRVIYATWADPRSFERAHTELRSLTTWANTELFAGIADGPDYDKKLDPIIVVALPPRNRFQKWINARFGNVDGNSLTQIGGAYEHLQVRLVSMDLGTSLRHEFFHGLHWRVCHRLGQRHPIWLQEGLASLVEDMDGLEGGKANAAPAKPVPSWRTNTAKRQSRGSGMLSLDDMIAVTPEAFNSQRPLAKYAQVRAFFLFLYQRGQLSPFLKTYCTDNEHGFAVDQSGKKALEHIFGKDTKELDKQFRAWLKDLPEVSEEVKPGQASLNISIESGNGDGVIVVDMPVGGTKSAAAAAGVSTIRIGDVIMSIEGRATRDTAELIRVLGDFQPGQKVTVTLRRDGVERDVPVTLGEKK
ncbi:MAG: PDZ domain-containing protein [Phycisphaerales bacterium]